VGSHKALMLLTDVLARGEGPEAVADELERIEEAARLTSICGLGQVALGPVMSVLRMRTEGEEGEAGRRGRRLRARTTLTRATVAGMAAAAGIVLAGGRSSRMGTPKATLEWHGRRCCGG
jgi:hypothetical protein